MAGSVVAVVVTYNAQDHLPDLLASVRRAPEVAAIVAVDNGSTDGTVEYLLDQPDVQLIRQGNVGFAAGVNAGIAAARSDLDVLVLNPDVVLDEGCVARLVAALDDDPRRGAVVPRVRDAAGRTTASLRRSPSPRSTLVEGVVGGSRAGRWGEAFAPRPGQPTVDVDWATGAVLLVRRRVLDALGGLDPSYFLYSEETEFLLRIGDAGHRVTCVTAATASHVGGSMSTDPLLWALRAVNRVRLQQRRDGRAAGLAMRAASLVFEARRAVTGGATSRRAVRSLARRDLDREAAALAAELGAADPALLLRDRGGRRGGPAPETPSRGWVCFAAQDWWYHNQAHSDFQLMRRVARDEPVLVVNSLAMRMPRPGRSSSVLQRVGRKARSLAKYVRRPLPDVPGFHVMTPLFLPVYGNPTARRLNGLLVSFQVRAVCRAIGVQRPAVVVTIPTAYESARRLDRRCLLVNRSDRYSALPEADTPVVAELERRLLAEADVALYSSHELMREEGPLARGETRFLDHGVDVDHFSRTQEHPDLVDVARPRAGYFGGLDDYTVDLPLFAQVADLLPDVQFVLVGDANGDISGLTSRPNVHWFGMRPYAEIPAFGSGFDVALMPWLDNDWIRYSNPIKLKEYLALDLPVVSTPFPELRHYPQVEVARGAEAFAAAIRSTLADDGEGDRRAAVVDQTWDERAARLVAIASEIGDDGAARQPTVARVSDVSA